MDKLTMDSPLGELILPPRATYRAHPASVSRFAPTPFANSLSALRRKRDRDGRRKSAAYANS